MIICKKWFIGRVSHGMEVSFLLKKIIMVEISLGEQGWKDMLKFRFINRASVLSDSCGSQWGTTNLPSKCCCSLTFFCYFQLLEELKWLLKEIHNEKLGHWSWSRCKSIERFCVKIHFFCFSICKPKWKEIVTADQKSVTAHVRLLIKFWYLRNYCF